MTSLYSSTPTDPELLELLERCRVAPPMTPKEIYDQRISWNYGETGTDKKRIKEILAKQGIVDPEGDAG